MNLYQVLQYNCLRFKHVWTTLTSYYTSYYMIN